MADPNYSQHADEHLQQLFHQGDQQAVDELARRHEPAFRRQALREAGGDEEVADAGFVRWFARLRDACSRRAYDPAKGAWMPWSRTVLRNAILEELRKRRRRDQHERTMGECLEPTPADGPPFPPELTAAVWEVFRPIVARYAPRDAAHPPGGPPDDPCAGGCELTLAFRKALRECLRELPAEDQRLFVCSTWGLKLSAEELGVKPATLRQRLHRARVAFHGCVSGKVPGVRHEC